MKTARQPWIYSPGVDGAFILAPALVMTAVIWLCRDLIAPLTTLPPWSWALLIVGVDVAHVYATLFRTYADREELQQRPALYMLTPLLCWALGALLYAGDALWFWRALAYLAVLHFMRQQYGFMMIYARRDDAPSWAKRIDQAAIYLATLYPLLFWHTHLPRQFDWFVAGDFLALPAGMIDQAAGAVYVLVMAAYLIKEAWFGRRERRINLPKNLLLLGTALSWFVGIVSFNNDLAFTALNVVAHGLPYIALTWIFCRNRAQEQKGASGAFLTGAKFFTLRLLPFFLLILVGLAYFEEGLWDALVWREHGTFFGWFQSLPQMGDPATLAWLVPLLALPQSTHYALDAFIWRLKGQNNGWRRTLFLHEQA